jgi:hypothetical protein
MSDIKVICKNHGIIQTIPSGVTWVGTPPKPWSHCPHCGCKTVIEYPARVDYNFTGYTCPTEEELAAAKAKEIAYYRDKYWRNNGN